MEAIETLAQKIDNKISETRGMGIDPATILVIIQIIVQIVKLIKMFRKPKGAARMVNYPGVVGRFFLWRQLRDFSDRQAAFEAFIFYGSTLNEEDMKKMFDEVDHRS